MATSDESQQSTGARPHVVTKGDVHVRRDTPTLRERFKPSKGEPSDKGNSSSKNTEGSADDSQNMAAVASPATTAKPSKRDASSAFAGKPKNESAREPSADENAESEESPGASRKFARRRAATAPSTGESPQSPESPQSSETESASGAHVTSEQSEGQRRSGGSDVEKPSDKPHEQPPQKKRLWLRVVIIVFAVLIVAAFVIAGLFAWNRWYRYDDAQDMQGQWYAAGTTVPVLITDTAIVLNEETSYQYEIDPQAKTISYSLVNMRGEGRYWFENDRQALVIVDGKGFTSTDTAIDDFARSVSSFFTTLTGGQVALPQGDGIIALTREPDAAALAAEKAAEAAAAEEEAARRHAEAEAVMAEVAAAEAEKAAAEKAAAEEAAAEEAADEETAVESDSAEKPAEQEFANESAGVFD